MKINREKKNGWYFYQKLSYRTSVLSLVFKTKIASCTSSNSVVNNTDSAETRMVIADRG